MYRLAVTANEWYSTWVNLHSDDVRRDLETIERKLRLVLKVIDKPEHHVGRIVPVHVPDLSNTEIITIQGDASL
jgi:hypothetical protein